MFLDSAVIYPDISLWEYGILTNSVKIKSFLVLIGSMCDNDIFVSG